MINREDMLELTRRMTPARTSFTRIAGCYVDADGDFDGSFNINFLKLSPSEKTKNLAIAKTIPFAETNTKLKKYEIQPENQKAGSMWQLLMALRDCELKNDALMDTLYDIIMENIRITTPYAIYVFHDNYDIPAKATDKERLGESEEMFSYLICATYCTAKTRYSQKECDAVVTPLEGGCAHVELLTPQRAVTAGQAVVFYDGEEVLGGGTIEKAL